MSACFFITDKFLSCKIKTKILPMYILLIKVDFQY